jgi:hypothetical protein
VDPILVFDEKRGDLLKVSLGDIPFLVKEVVTIFNVPIGVTRGCHAHKITQQLLVLISGKITVIIKSISGESRIVLDEPGDNVYLAPLNWGEQIFMAAGSVLQIYSSEAYDPDDYISDFSLLKEDWQRRELSF